MSFHRSRTGADLSIVSGIIAGRPWVAATVKNPHLRKHGRALGRTFRQGRAVTDELRGPCLRLFESVARQSQLLVRGHPLERDLVPMLVRVAAYAAEWLRPPEAWRAPAGAAPKEQWEDLLRHLFVEWPMPGFFYSAWRVRGDLRVLERDWFCHVGGGGSWRKAVDFPPSISSRAVHHALMAPADLTIRQALRWGQLMALGAPQALVDDVLGSGMVGDLSNDAVWSRLFAKLVAAGDFDAREFGVIADVLLELMAHFHFNFVRRLLDRPLAELRRHAFGRWRGLLAAAAAEGIRFRNPDVTRTGLRAELRHLTEAAWEPMPGIARFEVERREQGVEKSSVWWIGERLNHAQLMAEGREMRHCVSGYWRRCRSGRSAIFSLRQLHPAVAPERVVSRLTIEVDRGTRRIVQARGKWNRWPDEMEFGILAEWARSNGLGLAV
ncbi:PcfJ domain-containing protein [Luteolibacter marinus]|uniref:PcfJ domain-containing protein n=1 Tax=Luteolibacter marinus TaxID=2776705 RepID=UPI0018696066|nr:PcfJ domain-containing protein [Luteolibacter marinus]